MFDLLFWFLWIWVTNWWHFLTLEQLCSYLPPCSLLLDICDLLGALAFSWRTSSSSSYKAGLLTRNSVFVYLEMFLFCLIFERNFSGYSILGQLFFFFFLLWALRICYLTTFWVPLFLTKSQLHICLPDTRTGEDIKQSAT